MFFVVPVHVTVTFYNTTVFVRERKAASPSLHNASFGTNYTSVFLITTILKQTSIYPPFNDLQRPNCL